MLNVLDNRDEPSIQCLRFTVFGLLISELKGRGFKIITVLENFPLILNK